MRLIGLVMNTLMVCLIYYEVDNNYLQRLWSFLTVPVVEGMNTSY